MLKPILAALVAMPFLVAPALAVTKMPTVKAPVQECTQGTTADCAINVGRVRRV